MFFFGGGVFGPAEAVPLLQSVRDLKSVWGAVSQARKI